MPKILTMAKLLDMNAAQLLALGVGVIIIEVAWLIHRRRG